MLETVLEYLRPHKGESYLDLTAGYGGHASAVLSAISSNGSAVLVDQDEAAISALRSRFGKDKRVEIRHQNFAEAAKELTGANRQFDMVLVDAGVSSPQFDEAKRGFSLQANGPLDMRMDQRQPKTAADIVNESSRDQLADIIWSYGEEPGSRKIADAIIRHRPVRTTGELTAIIEQTIRRKGRIHPATRTFQAIRIAVNDELGVFERTLPHVLRLMAPGGRLVVISFHSLEDRLVKQFLRDHSGDLESELRLLTKKPRLGSIDDAINPRARSAKLRAAVKIKTNTERG